MESFRELDVEKYQIIATFDLKTSKICQEMDKEIFNIDDMKIGKNAPPLHPRCRSVIVPYYEKGYFTSTRAARDADGKTVQIPEDMTYKEWYELYGKDYKAKVNAVENKKKEKEKAKKEQEKEQEQKEKDLQKQNNNDIIQKSKESKGLDKKKVDNNMEVDEQFINNQTQLITDKSNSNVDRKFINSKAFHNNFENLTDSKIVNESLYQQSMEILEHRDGTQFEDLVAIDSRTGKVIAKNTLSEELGRTGFTDKQYENCINNVNDIILLHNHPNSTRPSFTDVETLFYNNMITASVVACHNGDVYMIHNPNRKIDIKKLWIQQLDRYIELGKPKKLAKLYALDVIYSQSKILNLKKGGISNEDSTKR